MGAHETLEASLAAVETQALALKAARLVAQFHAGIGLDPDRNGPRTRADWVQWEGEAYSLLRELARG